ncbi:uroporphyrinogen-III synthase [Ehrlichia chaffeensis]|uniref:uroporphyrinogen-III synthase n=1 Tax=Ehrlichia chaffeensis TaxID=945 RepID=UPI000444CC42|nr:uroporphyrinogen-III synthase [Ehrlichia chaffeensis]AHX08165.1 uroporphyrinogen-III synthase HemD family protein [Ehrlichia chaffeensis str. Saint Vincent]AHX09742.1 uroporphyrinogen-III synthase HemD family protein [Ehrlichia chaffeensis str. Wakulla]
MKSLLVTRPKKDSIKIKEYLNKQGFNVYIEPLFSIKYLITKININNFDLIISTSQHSIIALSKITKNWNIPIVTVGNNTMNTAQELGFTSVKSLNGNIDNVISYIKNHNRANILYIRGKEVTYNLKKSFNHYHNFQEIILYNTIDRKYLSKCCYNALLQNKISGILLYSSRTAKILIELIAKHNIQDKTRDITIYAMSDKIASTAKQACWKAIKTSDQPTNKSLLSLIP